MSRRRMFGRVSVFGEGGGTTPPPPPTGVRPYGRLFDGRDQYPGGFTPPIGISLPTFLDTTRPDFSAYTPHVVTNKTELTAAYEACDLADGGVIHLAPGFDVDRWRPAARTTSGRILIETQNVAGFDVATGAIRIVPEAGVRQGQGIGLTALSRFSLWESDPNVESFYAQAGVKGLRFRAVAFWHVPNPTFVNSNLVYTHPDAEDIVFEQCYFHQQKARSLRRGLVLQSYRSAVIDSWFDAAHSTGAESQSVAVWSSRGITKVVNNYMPGSGENFMAGGAAVKNPDDATLTYYPKDLEFRLNHCHYPKQLWEWTQEWADYYDPVNGAGTVGTSAAGTLTLSAGAFDLAEVSGTGTTFRSLYFVYVTSGPRAGSYAKIVAVPSTTEVTIESWYGPAAEPGDAIVVKYGPFYWQKNRFELKNMRRAYVAENVMEGHPLGVSQQYHAIVLKSVNQSNGPSIYSMTSDVCFVDNMVIGVHGGIALSKNPEGVAIQMARVWIENNLVVSGYVFPWHNRREGISMDANDLLVRNNTFYGFEYSAARSSGATHRDVTVTRNVISGREGGYQGWWLDVAGARPKNNFANRYTETGFVTNNGWLDPRATFTTADYNLDGDPRLSGNIVVSTLDQIGVANRSTDWWGAADWGLSDSSPFQDASGKWGVDYQRVKALTANVRGVGVPQDDWGIV